MFSRKKENETTDLQDAITELVKEMREHQGNTEEYTAIAGNVKTLIEASAIENKMDDWQKPSLDTVITVAGSLAGILAILSYERANVITSKAVGFIIRPKN